jgi:hypothetical protein
MNQKSYFTWTEDKLALRHEGYKLTDRNHQEKWEIIIVKLKMIPEFAELEIQPIALKNQFFRMQKDVLKAAGISMERANLSGPILQSPFHSVRIPSASLIHAASSILAADQVYT